MKTYTTINFENLPVKVHEAIMEFKKDSIIVDDTMLTAPQLLKLETWLKKQGYE